MNEQRRWVIRPVGSREDGPTLVVQIAADGQVFIDAPRGPVRFAPQDVERLRRALTEARAGALWLVGTW